jgi:hypothetical protein
MLGTKFASIPPMFQKSKLLKQSALTSFLALPSLLASSQAKAQIVPQLMPQTNNFVSETVESKASGYLLKKTFASDLSLEEFLKLSDLHNSVVLQGPDGSKLPAFPFAEMLSTNNFFFFSLDYVFAGSKEIAGPEKEADISKMHEITPSALGLGVRTILLGRDYEFDSHDKGADPNQVQSSALAAKEHDAVKERAFDTLHVVALSENSISDGERSLFDIAVTDPSFFAATDAGSRQRQSVLRISKKNSDHTHHKVLKGPFWNKKNAFFQKPEEEWGAGTLAPREAVRYKHPVVFADLQGDRFKFADTIYLVFFADDSGDWRLMQSPDPLGDRDDIAAVFRIHKSDVSTLGSRRILMKAGKNPGLPDIVVELETFDSSTDEIMKSLRFHNLNKTNIVVGDQH